MVKKNDKIDRVTNLSYLVTESEDQCDLQVSRYEAASSSSDPNEINH